MKVGFNEEGIFTFINFITLSVHLSLKHITLNQALHDLL